MDGNGFTGLNPEQATRDLDSFYDATLNIKVKMEKAMSKFLSDNLGIRKAWCSPNAVEFSKNYISKYYRVLAEFTKYTMATYNNAVRSYNRMASANGTEPYSSKLQSAQELLTRATGNNTAANDAETGNNYIRAAEGLENGTLYALLPEHPVSGDVGMNVASVREAFNYFKMDCAALLNEIEEIPTSLALFDQNGEQQAVFETKINELKNCFFSEVVEMEIAIENATSTEVNNTLLAYQQSIDALQRNA